MNGIAVNGPVNGPTIMKDCLNVTLTKLFSVDSYDLKSFSFKIGNYIFITFEMPRLSFTMVFWKIKISLLFCPFASEVLG